MRMRMHMHVHMTHAHAHAHGREQTLGRVHHAAISRVLFIYAKLNPGIRYVQVLAPSRPSEPRAELRPSSGRAQAELRPSLRPSSA